MIAAALLLFAFCGWLLWFMFHPYPVEPETMQRHDFTDIPLKRGTLTASVWAPVRHGIEIERAIRRWAIRLDHLDHNLDDELERELLPFQARVISITLSGTEVPQAKHKPTRGDRFKSKITAGNQLVAAYQDIQKETDLTLPDICLNPAEIHQYAKDDLTNIFHHPDQQI